MDRTYNRNAEVQRGQGAALLESVRACSTKIGNSASLLIADYGCGPGGNSVEPLRAVLAGATSAEVPRVQALMVDSQTDPELCKQLDEKLEALKTGPLPDFKWSNLPQSFYQPLPDNFQARVDLAWSSVAAHWLSELPTDCPNFIVGNADGVNSEIRRMWMQRAEEDWELWLRLRAAEVRPGGRMIVAMPGRDSSGDFVARGAWSIFAAIKASLLKDGCLSAASAARVATREFWRSTEEVLAPFQASDAAFEIEDYWLEHRPCPFVTAKLAGKLTAQECAEKLVSAFQGFLRTEFDEALGDASSVFWSAARDKALVDAEKMDLHVVMHHLTLRRKLGDKEAPPSPTQNVQEAMSPENFNKRRRLP